MGSLVLTSSNATWLWASISPVTTITAEAIGGAGAGAYCAGNPIYGGGGKGAGYAKVVITKGAETSLNITVGAGGTAASAGATTDGTASTIVQGATTVLSATGGKSAPQDSQTGQTTAVGTLIGTVTNAGGDGASPSGTNSGAGGGAGGPSGPGSGATSGGGSFADGVAYDGDGGASVAVRNVGNPGEAGKYGGAGSGGSTNQTSDKAGGAGANGVVVLTWTDPVTVDDDLARGSITEDARALGILARSEAAPAAVVDTATATDLSLGDQTQTDTDLVTLGQGIALTVREAQDGEGPIVLGLAETASASDVTAAPPALVSAGDLAASAISETQANLLASGVDDAVAIGLVDIAQSLISAASADPLSVQEGEDVTPSAVVLADSQSAVGMTESGSATTISGEGEIVASDVLSVADAIALTVQEVHDGEAPTSVGLSESAAMSDITVSDTTPVAASDSAISGANERSGVGAIAGSADLEGIAVAESGIPAAMSTRDDATGIGIAESAGVVAQPASDDAVRSRLIETAALDISGAAELAASDTVSAQCAERAVLTIADYAEPAIEPGGYASTWPPSPYALEPPKPEPKPRVVILARVVSVAPAPVEEAVVEVEDLAALYREDEDWLLAEVA